MSCPKCNSDSLQKIIYDFGYGLSMVCTDCNYYYKIVEGVGYKEVD